MPHDMGVIVADSFHFCSDEFSANYCADLVVKGIKSATCSLAYWYDQLGESEPAIGDYWIITNWQQLPIALVKVEAVKRSKFCDVDDIFAYKEGEGDRSLIYWQKEHEMFFRADCARLNINFYDDIELSLQEFSLVELL